MAQFGSVIHRTRTLKADFLLIQNIRALLAVRNTELKALAMYAGHKPAWISKIMSGERGVKLSDLDKIADFFGLTVAQLFQHGVSPLTERRRKDRRCNGERRTGGDRRGTQASIHDDVVAVFPKPKKQKKQVEELPRSIVFKQRPGEEPV